MDTNESNRTESVNRQTYDSLDADERPAFGPFILVVGECAELVARIKEKLDDHLGVSPDEVAWGNVADAERLLLHLRQAAFVAGIVEDPAS